MARALRAVVTPERGAGARADRSGGRSFHRDGRPYGRPEAARRPSHRPAAHGGAAFAVVQGFGQATAEGRDPRATSVRDVMTPGVVCAFGDQDVGEGARLMTEERRVRRLVVVSRKGRLAGGVSVDDPAGEAGDERLAGERLARVSRPLAPR